MPNIHKPSWFYRFSYSMIDLLAHSYFSIRLEGLEHVPAEGGVIIAANHKSLIDPPILSYAVMKRGRMPHFMGKRELFRNPVLGWIMRSWGGFPVDRRGGDVGAMRNAIEILERGDVLVLFPEGTRMRENRLTHFKPGMAFLSLKAQKPVIPAFISDFGSFPKPGSTVTVRFGPSIPYLEIAKCTPKEAAQSVLEAVRRLIHA